jgi:hypothetical protein
MCSIILQCFMLVFHKYLLSSSFWNVHDLDIFWNISLDQNVGIYNINADYKGSGVKYWYISAYYWVNVHFIGTLSSI